MNPEHERGRRKATRNTQHATRSAHKKSFWLHIKPPFYHRAVTPFAYTFRLGLLSVYFFMVEALTGILLMTWYAPTPERAYTDMVQIIAYAPMGQFLRNLHHLAAAGMLITVVLHLARTFITASYKPPRRLTWLTGVLLLLLTLALAFTGYLLPWDQLAYWAVTIGANLMQAVPTPPGLAGIGAALGGQSDWLGPLLYKTLVGGIEVGANTLLRFYILHILLLPLLVMILLGIHYYRVVRFGISLPPSLELEAPSPEKTIPRPQRRYYLMDVALDEMLFLAVTTLFLFLLAAFFHSPPLQNPADPLHTPPQIVAPWYFLWLQGLLKLGSTSLFGVILPCFFLLLLALLPYLDRNPHRRPRQRRFALTVGLLGAALIVWLSFWGLPSSHQTQTPPAETLVQTFMPEEGVGPLRSIPWAALTPGRYCTGATGDAPPNAALAAILQDFRQQLAADPALDQDSSCLLIDDIQTKLKRIRFYIRYDTDTGAPAALLHDTYRHQ